MLSFWLWGSMFGCFDSSLRWKCVSLFCFFFFQAEDGIRDLTVTGVQTCALPILQGGALRFHIGAGADGGQGAGLEADRAEAAAGRVGAALRVGGRRLAATGKHQAGQHSGQREVVSLHRACFPWRTFLPTTTGCRGRCDPTYTGSASAAMGRGGFPGGTAQARRSRPSALARYSAASAAASSGDRSLGLSSTASPRRGVPVPGRGAGRAGPGWEGGGIAAAPAFASSCVLPAITSTNSSPP